MPRDVLWVFAKGPKILEIADILGTVRVEKNDESWRRALSSSFCLRICAQGSPCGMGLFSSCPMSTHDGPTCARVLLCECLCSLRASSARLGQACSWCAFWRTSRPSRGLQGQPCLGDVVSSCLENLARGRKRWPTPTPPSGACGNRVLPPSPRGGQAPPPPRWKCACVLLDRD